MVQCMENHQHLSIVSKPRAVWMVNKHCAYVINPGIIIHYNLHTHLNLHRYFYEYFCVGGWSVLSWAVKLWISVFCLFFVVFRFGGIIHKLYLTIDPGK